MVLENETKENLKAHSKWIAFLVAAAFFMENLDATVITTALPQMGLTFKTDPVNINIGISAYMLTLGVFIPASGWLTDRYGSRLMFSLAVVIFTLASFLCGLSNNLPMFVCCRILQGLGGAMMVPVGRLVVLRQTPKDRLVHAIALLTWPGLVAPVLGPPIGGFIAQYAHWSLIFYLNIPIGIAILLFSLKLFPNERGVETKPLDSVGFLLTGIGLATLLFAAEDIGGARGISYWSIIFFALGASALGLSVMHLKTTKNPLLSLDALKFKSFAVSIYGGTLFRMTANAIIFIFPLMAQLALGFSPAQSGLLLMPIFIGNLAIKPFTTALMRMFGFRRILIWNCILNAMFLAACGFFDEKTPFWLMIVILALSGVFRSIQFTALNTIAFADTSRESMNGANTLFSTVFQLGIGLGVALGAIALRLGTSLTGITIEAGVAPFQAAFFVIAFISIIPLFGILRLQHGVGDLVAGRMKR